MSDDEFRPIPADGLLMALAELARTQEGFELSITVNVPGATVTGIMIGPRQWLRILGASGEGKTNQFLGSVAAALDALLESPAEDVAAQCLHLRQAQYVSGGTFTPTNAALLWRGRISEVAGFSIGTLSAAE